MACHLDGGQFLQGWSQVSLRMLPSACLWASDVVSCSVACFVVTQDRWGVSDHYSLGYGIKMQPLQPPVSDNYLNQWNNAVTVMYTYSNLQHIVTTHETIVGLARFPLASPASLKLTCMASIVHTCWWSTQLLPSVIRLSSFCKLVALYTSVTL